MNTYFRTGHLIPELSFLEALQVAVILAVHLVVAAAVGVLVVRTLGWLLVSSPVQER